MFPARLSMLRTPACCVSAFFEFCVLVVSVSIVLRFGGFYFSFQRFSLSFNIACTQELKVCHLLLALLCIHTQSWDVMFVSAVQFQFQRFRFSFKRFVFLRFAF